MTLGGVTVDTSNLADLDTWASDGDFRRVNLKFAELTHWRVAETLAGDCSEDYDSAGVNRDNLNMWIQKGCQAKFHVCGKSEFMIKIIIKISV